MAETLLSPGVLARENDQSQVTSGPQSIGAAIIGPTALGPVNIPTIVTSYSEYKTLFDATIMSGSNTYSFLTSIAVNNYFQNGGLSMLVTRVVTGSFSPATSSAMTALGVADDPTKLLSPFILETLSEGELMNNDEGADTEISGGAMLSGSQYNIRWEIPQVNSASGQFSLIIRRGDDRTAQKTVLEQYNNLSLDPQSSNYISKVIGDIDYSLAQDGTDYFVQESGSYNNKSRFVRVKQVNYKTPQYFDNTGSPKNEFTGSLPSVQSGSFGDAVGSNIVTDRAMNFYENINGTDSQGMTGPCYSNVINLLSNQDEYQYNIIAAPGLINASTGHASEITSMVNNSIARGDNMSIIDLVEYNAQVADVTDQSAGFDNSYSATYWPWLQTVDPNTGELVWVPASTMIPGVMAYTDASSEPWFAPAGITRGGLGQVVRAERKLTVSQRDTLYEANINPIASFPQQGVVVFGQKTLQKRASALDRINVRRLLIQLKGYISQVADNLVFEQNTIATRNNFLTQVNPYLESVQQRQGLYAFKVVMDDSNNTPDVIDRNELLGQIFIQPTRTAEFVILDFNVLPTGATFPA
ncbi:phage tail sheath subtilisin-like domain-containing protein [bacterium]|nr:phage tail sheath subtilisin-like domain-containing protein [bacterium]